MAKIEVNYAYIAIPSVENWFEISGEPLSVIKKAVTKLLRNHEISECCRVEVRRYSNSKISQKFVVWNKSKTLVKFVKNI
jgi:hypothetical protein